MLISLKKINQIGKALLLWLALNLVGISSAHGAFPIKEVTETEKNSAMIDLSKLGDEPIIAQTAYAKTNATSTKTHGGKSRIVAALFAIFAGTFGVHSFYLGQKNKGINIGNCGIYNVLYWSLFNCKCFRWCCAIYIHCIDYID